MGKEEGLNLYLQLFRFRVHQGNINEHIFRTSLLELQRFTKVNEKKRLPLKKVVYVLMQMEDAGVIKVHNAKIENLIGNEMLIIEATDVPSTVRENGKDKIVDENYYIPVNFKMIEYMYDELQFTAKEMAMYLLFRKYGGRQGESKVTMTINTIKERLGTRNEKVIDMMEKFNEYGIAATSIRRKGRKTVFEHVICTNINKIEQFKMNTGEIRDNFLNR